MIPLGYTYQYTRREELKDYKGGMGLLRRWDWEITRMCTFSLSAIYLVACAEFSLKNIQRPRICWRDINASGSRYVKPESSEKQLG